MIKIGLIGAGANTRSRHIPGLRAIPDVEIVAVCNRRPESTRAVAAEFGIPRVYDDWHVLLRAPDIDAVVIGTWPYLHAPITLEALECGKHVLTEARMAMDAAEARLMLDASQRHPNLVSQIVPSPFGLKGDLMMRDLLAAGFLGEIREASLTHRTAALADPAAPLHWRQDAELSGYNMLTLGILHETLLRWLPQPTRVTARAHAFIPTRPDGKGGTQSVGTPDSVQVIAELPDGARSVYQFSGVTPFGQEATITLYGSQGALRYDLTRDVIRGASKVLGSNPMGADEMPEIHIPADRAGGWRVEADFIDSIRAGAPVVYTDFESGVQYMEFTEAVARSAHSGTPVELPLT
jgi:predicted dehydrogenase